MTDTTTALPKHRWPRWARISAWLGGTVLALFVCLVLFVVFFAESLIKEQAGTRGSAATGRTFAIEGPVKIDWHWNRADVHLEKIRLANAPGLEDADMVSVGNLDFSIRFWHLLHGQLNLPELKISKARIVLEKQDADHKNWDLPAFSKGNAVATATVPKERHDFPVIGLLTLTDSELIYRDRSKKLDLDLTLNTASGSATGKKEDDRGITVSGKGTLQDKIFTLDVKGGSVAMLRGSSKPFPLSIALEMGATKIKADGTFKDPVKMQGVDTHVSIEGDNLADLFYLTAIPLPPTPHYAIEGQLKQDNDIWSYNDFKGKVGNSDLAGNLKYDTTGERGLATIQIVSNSLDMNDLAGFIGKTAKEKGDAELGAEQKAQAAKQAASGRVLPDVPINLDRLRASDMIVDFDAKKFHQEGTPLESLKAHIDLHDGLLKIDPLTVGVASGTVEGSLTLDGREAVPVVGTNIMLKKLSLKDFFKGSKFADVSAGRFGGRIDLKGKGKSLADVLAVSNGELTVSMAGGRISLLIVKAAGLDIANIAPLLIGPDETTNIRCFVGDFEVADGFLKSRVFDFDTQDSNIYGYAGINMKNEALDISMKSHPKSASVLQPLTAIKVGGTMKKPSIGIDPVEAGARAGVAVGLSAVLTPLAAIIPFINLGLGEDSDCRGLIAEAQNIPRAKAPPEPPASD